MLSQTLLEQVRKMAEEVSEREGCQLYDIEFIGAGAGRILRVYIDKSAEKNADPSAQGATGVSIDDCSNVSRGLNLRLDVEDVIPGGAYALEVSSPGLDRVLRQPWHFEKALQKTISVKCFRPLLDFNPELVELGKAKQMTGKLLEMQSDGIKVEMKEKSVFVPFAEMTKAQMVFEIEGPAGPPGKPGKHAKKK